MLGLEDTSDDNQFTFYTELKEQIQRTPHGWYQIGLPWNPIHPNLYNNKNRTPACLSNLLSKLQRDPTLFKELDGKIKD